MELVYLWVEKYKNIEKQGFNFSPRFNVKFNPVYDEKNCCEENKVKLSIKEESHPIFTLNKEYKKVNLFPDNININAIVGENGSGKTSLLLELLLHGDFENIKRTKLWVCDKDSDTPEYISFNEIHSKEGITKSRVFLIQDDIDSYDYGNAYTIDSAMEIDYSNTDELSKRHKRQNLAISYLGASKNNSILRKIPFVPTHLELALKNSYSFNLKSFLPSLSNLILDDNSIKYINDLISQMSKESVKFFIENKDIKYYLMIRSFLHALYIQYTGVLELLKLISIEKKNFSTIVDFINYLESKEIYNKSKDKDYYKLIDELNDLLKDESLQNQKFILNLDNKNIEKILINAEKHWFDIDFILYKEKEEVRFKYLSSGEKRLLSNFAKMNYVFTKFDYKVENFIFLIDEPDIYLHPDWQKKYISYLIDFIQHHSVLGTKNIQIIISTHSPFILSDLPKQNIIFLKDGEQVDGLEKKETFGANIHTLLSDGFFMSDGLMGEFAKSNIDEIIDYLNGNKETTIKDNDDAQKRINIIGEPIIKKQLQKMLDSKRLSKIDEVNQRIKDMEYQLSVLKKYQSNMVQDELNNKAKKKYYKKKNNDKD